MQTTCIFCLSSRFRKGSFMATTTIKPVKNAGKISGSTLKIIAMACMLIDHTAAVLFDRILISRGLLNAVNASDGGASFLSTGNTAVIYYADMIMRAIGRISFPIFCFLLIEGFMHTHDVKKYALNLGILHWFRRFRSIWHLRENRFIWIIRMSFSLYLSAL